jgi:hypothetical protein
MNEILEIAKTLSSLGIRPHQYLVSETTWRLLMSEASVKLYSEPPFTLAGAPVKRERYLENSIEQPDQSKLPDDLIIAEYYFDDVPHLPYFQREEGAKPKVWRIAMKLRSRSQSKSG